MRRVVPHSAHLAMRNRPIQYLTLLTTLFVTLGFLPGAPWLRDSAWRIAQVGAHAWGIDLTLANTRGNLWRGITLEGLTVQAEGAALHLTAVDLQWSWARLWAGEILVSVDARGLSGSVDGERLLAALGDTLVARESAPGWPRLVWRDVQLQVGDLSLAGVPFTLPDMTVQRFQAGVEAGSWHASAIVVSEHGRIDAGAWGRFGADSFQGELRHADVRFARTWWTGLEGGHVRGPFRWQEGQFSGEFDLHNGALRVFGEPVQKITGPIRWAGDDLAAELTGESLAGTLSAAGTLNLAQQHWRVEGDFDVALAPLGRAGLTRMGLASLPTATEGMVRGQLAASGWTDVNLTLRGEALGTYLGATLDVPVITLGFLTAAGVSANLAGHWGGGSVAFELLPQATGSVLNASLVAVDLGVGTIDSLAIALGSGTRSDLLASGTFSGTPWGLALSQPASAWLGTLTADGIGELRLDGSQVFGEGATPAWRWGGVEVASLPWRVTGDLGHSLQATLGDSELQWFAASPGWQLSVSQTLGWQADVAMLHGSVAENRVALQLRLPAGAGVEATGTPTNLNLTAVGAASSFAMALRPEFAPGGAFEVAGALAATLRWQPGVAPSGDLAWVLDETATLQLALDDGQLSGHGLGLALQWRDETLTVQTERTPLGYFFVREDVSVELVADLEIPWRAGIGGAGEATAVMTIAPTLRAQASLVFDADGAAGWSLAVEREMLALTAVGRWAPRDSWLAVTGEVSWSAGRWQPVAWQAGRIALDRTDERWQLRALEGVTGALPGSMQVALRVADEPLVLDVRLLEGRWGLEAHHPWVTASLSGEAQDWQLEAAAQPGAGSHFALQASGAGLAAQGRWSLGRAEPLVSEVIPYVGGSLAWEGERLTLELRADGVNRDTLPALVDVSGALSLELSLSGWFTRGDLRAGLVTGEQPPALVSLNADGQQLAISLLGVLAGVEVDLKVHGSPLPGSPWRLSGAMADNPIDVRWGGIGRDDSAASIADAWTWDGADGLGVARGPAGSTVRVLWDPSPSSHVDALLDIAGYRGELGLARDERGEWHLDIALQHLTRTETLTLAGNLFPLSLAGSLQLSQRSFPLSLRADPSWALAWGDLSLAWQAGSMVLSGATATGQLPLAQLRSDGLAWSSAAGWAGRVAFTSNLPDGWHFAGTLGGAGDLSGWSAWQVAGMSVGGAQVQIGADPRSGLTLAVALAAPLPGWPAVSTALTGTLHFDDTGWNGDLELQVRGDLTASGSLTVVASEARLDAQGPHLNLAARATANAIDAQLTLIELPIGAILPYPADARLSARGVMAGPITRLAWRVDDLRIDADAANLEGEIAGRFDRDASPTLAGELRAAGRLPLGVDAQWRGALQLTGSFAAPALAGSWSLSGPDAELVGGLDWISATQSASLRAQGRLLDAHVDVDVSVHDSAFSGAGEVRAGAQRWALRSVAGDLWLVAPQAADSPLVRIDAASRVATVDLAIEPYLPREGQLFGTVSLAAGGSPKLDLAWREVSIIGVELGSGIINGDLSRGFQAVAGDLETSGLHARYHPATGDWLVVLERLPTPFEGLLSLSASAGDGPLHARWHTRSSALPADLTLFAEGSPNGWTGAVTGEVAGGSIHWPWHLTEGELRGRGQLASAQLLGQPLQAEFELTGSWRQPSLLTHTRWHGADVRGRLWPSIDVTLDTGVGDGARLVGGWNDAPLRVTGGVELGLAGFKVALSEPDTVHVRFDTLNAGLIGRLPALALLPATQQILRDGWTWVGTGNLVGALEIGGAAGRWVASDGLELESELGRWRLTGELAGGLGHGNLSGDLGSLPALVRETLAWDWGAPLEGRWGWDGDALTVRANAPWELALTIAPTPAQLALQVALHPTTRDAWVGQLSLADGWHGSLRLRASRVFAGAPMGLQADVVGSGAHLLLDGSLSELRGVASFSGRWDGRPLFPDSWLPVPMMPSPFELDVRLLDLNLADIGSELALAGQVNGTLSWRQGRVLGRIASDALTFGATTSPASLEVQASLLSGSPASGQARVDIAGAQATLDFDAQGVAGLLRLERYALGDWIGLWGLGSDLMIEASGAIRGRWHWGDLVPRDLRVALEPVRLERAGAVSHGVLAFDWDGEALAIGQAAFDGDGSWRLRGEASPALLDLELLAQAADFGPLLGLLPAFVMYGVDARGDLVLRAQGTPAAPDVVFLSDNLELQVAGTHYHLSGLRLTLQDDRWNGRSDLRAISPVSGSMVLTSSGVVRSWLNGDYTLTAQAEGALDIPFLGPVEAISAEVAWTGGENPTLDASGALGSRFQLAGTLAPLDLRGSGQGLTLAIPFLAIADAVADVDLRLVGESDGVALSGRIDASMVRIDLDTRARYVEAQLPRSDRSNLDNPRVRNPLERLRFDAVRIVAPQRVAINESFAAGDGAVDLTLDGSAADPRLSGSFRALRGSVRFSGRDLDILAGVATFDPTRGVFPSVRVVGQTTFEKNRVAGPGVRFVGPPGSAFDVTLLLEGEMIGRDEGFSLNLDPTLTSNASVEGGGGVGARPLSENEILTLLTVGRLELGSGSASAVAQSALDTALDLLLTNEIQAALSSALGVDVVELRTTAIATLLDGDDPFGVSLRLGGYLSDEVFASYRVATSGGDWVASEVALAYQLGPVAFDITGRFDVGPGADAGPASLTLAARYGLARGWDVEFGFDLSTQESTTRVGVSWRW